MDRIYNMRLKVLSPVHIGSGESYSRNTDYIYEKNKVYYIDDHKLNDFFKSQEDIDKILDDYTNLIGLFADGYSKKKYSIKDFFDKYGLDLEEYSSDKIEVDNYISEEIKTIIKTSDRPYIPASSIKGAIKNAALYSILLENNIDLSEKIDDRIFGSFGKDIYKYIQITDTNTIESGNIDIYKSVRYNLLKNSEQVPVILETLKKGTEFNFRIKMIKPITDSPYIKYHDYLNEMSLENLCKKINKFSSDFIKRELSEFRKLDRSIFGNIINRYNEILDEIEGLEKNQAIFRLGTGKSFYGNTLALLMSNEELKRYARTKEPQNFPFTRQIILANDKYIDSLGWIKIEEV